MHSFQSHRRDGPPSLLPHHISWIDVVDVWAKSPFVVSGVLHGLDVEKVEAEGPEKMTRGGVNGSQSKFLCKN
jgi:hypothetical protein